MFNQAPARRAVFWKTPLEQVGQTKASHVKTCGYVKVVRYERDGDHHILLTRTPDAGLTTKGLVVETTPYIPLQTPKERTYIEVEGFPRIDPDHRWPEINPVVTWKEVERCDY